MIIKEAHPISSCLRYNLLIHCASDMLITASAEDRLNNQLTFASEWALKMSFVSKSLDVGRAAVSLQISDQNFAHRPMFCKKIQRCCTRGISDTVWLSLQHSLKKILCIIGRACIQQFVFLCPTLNRDQRSLKLKRWSVSRGSVSTF